ncbi:MAG: hypothetical protein AAGM67_00720 [Bacteroidota bacterium]
MSIVLRHSHVQVRVDSSGELYQGTRFDRACPIIELEYQGHEISAPEDLRQPEHPGLGRGLVNEFGIDGPLGFAQARPGDWVHKIGVGLIQKEEGPYDIHHLYRVRPATFSHQLSGKVIQSVCHGQPHDGYAYRLEKIITLLEDGLELVYQLHNLGEKTIQTEEYNHNFVALGAGKIGPAYTLHLAFSLQPQAFDEVVNPQTIVQMGEKHLHFADTPKTPFFFSNLSAGAMVPASWELHNKQTGLILTETADFKTQKINLWGSGHVISPELFFAIRLESGQSVNWRRRYQLKSTD